MTENNKLLKISEDPFALFNQWFKEAEHSEINDPNAMNLSTVSEDFKPSSRMVLLKSFNNQGFIFYTNTNSKKGLSIKKNPNVALNFHWKSLLKQIRIEGIIKQVSDDEADKYFGNTLYDSWLKIKAEEMRSNALMWAFKKEPDIIPWMLQNQKRRKKFIEFRQFGKKYKPLKSHPFRAYE